MAEYADYWTYDAPQRPALLGLIGKARAGKDSFARRLVEAHGFVRVAFADPLKQAALELNPIVVPGEGPDDPFEPTLRLQDVVLQYGWEVAKDEIPEVRRILQHIGQAVRKIDPDFWLRIGMAEAERLQREGFPVVITDVRYLNEAQAVVRRGGSNARIIRPDGPGASVDHDSEHELDDWAAGYNVLNDGDLARLARWADDIAAHLRKSPRAS